MFEFVLIVQLMANGPTAEIPVHDCAEMARWIDAARAWAKRSGVEQSERAMCYPADSPVLVRVRHE